jgi:hypothetical protein
MNSLSPPPKLSLIAVVSLPCPNDTHCAKGIGGEWGSARHRLAASPVPGRAGNTSVYDHKFRSGSPFAIYFCGPRFVKPHRRPSRN